MKALKTYQNIEFTFDRKKLALGFRDCIMTHLVKRLRDVYAITITTKHIIINGSHAIPAELQLKRMETTFYEYTDRPVRCSLMIPNQFVRQLKVKTV